MTRDGKVVVFHDLDLARIFGPDFRGKRVADLDYEELPAFPPSAVHTADAHWEALGLKAVHTQDPPYKQSPTSSPLSAPVVVPLLDEVFREFPSLPIQVKWGGAQPVVKVWLEI